MNFVYSPGLAYQISVQ